MKSRLVVNGGPRWVTAPRRALREGSGSGCRLMALAGRSGAPHPLAREGRHGVKVPSLNWTLRQTLSSEAMPTSARTYQPTPRR